MILVTVGTSSWDFTRLLREMDRIAEVIDEEVVMQISDINYEVKNAKYFRFTSACEINALYEQASVIISHAGVGCIISALKKDKPIIIIPRRKKFREHFDDHQVDIARELEREGKVKVVWDIETLESAIREIKRDSLAIEKDNRLIRHLTDYLGKI